MRRRIEAHCIRNLHFDSPGKSPAPLIDRALTSLCTFEGPDRKFEIVKFLDDAATILGYHPLLRAGECSQEIER